VAEWSAVLLVRISRQLQKPLKNGEKELRREQEALRYAPGRNSVKFGSAHNGRTYEEARCTKGGT
jgi:hypothetical protein